MEEKNEPMIPVKDHVEIVRNMSNRNMWIYIVMCICWATTLLYSMSVQKNATTSYFRTAYSDGTATNNNSNVNINGVEDLKLNGVDD